MKRRTLIFAGALLLLKLNILLNAGVPVTVMKLETVKPVDTFYTGKVEAIRKGTFSFLNPGILKSVAKVGDYVFSQIEDEKGNVIRPGSVIAKQIREEKKYELQAAVLNKKIAEVNYEDAKDDFARDNRLINNNAISEKKHFHSKTEMYKKKFAVENAKNEVLKCKFAYEAAVIKAHFSGMVTKVLKETGALAGAGDDVVEVTQMTPLLVKIPFPEDIIDNYKEGSTVKVYPSGNIEPVDAWCCTSVKNDMLYAYIENTVVPSNVFVSRSKTQEIRKSKLKKVYVWFPVVPMDRTNEIARKLGNISHISGKKIMNSLAVPIAAVRTDRNDRKYVLKTIPYKKNNEKSEGISRFKIEKIFIEVGNIKRVLDLGLGRNMKIVSVNKTEGLKQGDVVVTVGEKGIKDGDIVLQENVRWKFYPGESVKVEIPNLADAGIYVPGKAVIHQASGHNYVYLV
ncbi:MAG: hypothetical protein K9L78_04065, partial [Victivallales bacterium]|nr:hypothetical protein [Victivallales bacterium]